MATTNGAGRAVWSRMTLMVAAGMAATLSLLAVTHAEARPRRYGGYAPAYSAIVVDAKTGETIHAEAADAQRFPASITKVMTLYLLFEQIDAGRFSLQSPLRVSAEAARQPPSKVGVRPGSTITVEEAIRALVTKSANDVAVVVAENISGSEEAFGQLMTRKARAIGMSRTTFRNASGLPDPEQVTTARDMSLLGRRLIADFPDRYHYFGTQYFAHGNRMIRNHNGMLRDYSGTDGIKTGFINASGFNIVTSAQREGVRLVGAVFGGSSWPQRNGHMAELLDDGFQRMGVRSVPVMAAAAPRVARGRDATLGPGPRRAAPQIAARPGQPRVQNVSTSRNVAPRPAAAPQANRPARAAPNRAATPHPAQARPAPARAPARATTAPAPARPAAAPARTTQAQPPRSAG